MLNTMVTIADADLDVRQVEALDACVVASAALASEEGPAAERARLVMECHGRFVHAWGPSRPAAGFAEFLQALRGDSIAGLLPGGVRGGEFTARRLLEEDGGMSPWLADLAFAGGAGAGRVPGIGSELAHLASVLRALGKLPAGAGLARITAEAVQFALFSSLLARGPVAYTGGRECVIRRPVTTRRALSDLEAMVELGVYTDISPSRQFAGWWMACPICRWTMRARPRSGGVEFACEDGAHRERGCRFAAERSATEWQVRARGVEAGAGPRAGAGAGGVVLRRVAVDHHPGPVGDRVGRVGALGRCAGAVVAGR